MLKTNIMEFKGTKGKWKVEELSGNFLIIDEDRNLLNIRDVYPNALLASKSPEMLERLYQQNIDLKILYVNMLDIEKTNNRAEGMSVLIQKCIDKNEQIIKDATEL